MRNNADNTTRAVIVDPANGNVLYNQPLPSLFAESAGCLGMFGQGKMGPKFVGYGSGMGRFGEHRGVTMRPLPHTAPTG